MTAGKNITLTRQIFVDKVMSLLFNMLSRLVIYSSSIYYNCIYVDNLRFLVGILISNFQK